MPQELEEVQRYMHPEIIESGLSLKDKDDGPEEIRIPRRGPAMADTPVDYGVLSEVINHVFLGGVSGRTMENMRKYKIKCIINASIQISTLFMSGVENIKLWVADSPMTDLRSHFHPMADKIKSHADKGENSYVHCQAGISRSSTLVLAYMVKHCNLSLYEAFKILDRLRPLVRPNCGFWNQLLAFEQEVRGRISMRLVKSDGALWPVPQPIVN